MLLLSLNICLFAENTMMKKARQFGSKDLYSKAQAIEMQACDKIDYFHNHGRFA